VKQVADNAAAAINSVVFCMTNETFEACPVLSLFPV
jgi:hypothetical protein